MTPIRELAIECRKQGIKLGFYYSQDQDWTAPGGAAYKRGKNAHDPLIIGSRRRTACDFATHLHLKAIPTQTKQLSIA